MHYKSLFFILCLIGSLSLLFSNCQPQADVLKAQYITNGQKLYNTHCKNCHGDDGMGLGKLYPPLNDQKFYEDHTEKLACYIKYGIDTPLIIHGVEYTTKMPANPTLTNIDIAYLITYVTTQFGESDSLITQEDVIKQLEICR